MVRRGLVLAAAALLIVAIVAAGSSRKAAPPYEPDDVVRAFAAQGFALAEPAPELGWGDPTGAMLLTRPIASARFLVFVARHEAVAETFFMQLTQSGRTPDAFDVIRKNVVVSSDASFTENGLNQDEKRRIRAAMNSLSTAS